MGVNTRDLNATCPKAELPEDAVVKLVYFHQDQVTRLPEEQSGWPAAISVITGFTLCTTDGVQTVLCLPGAEFDAGYSTALLDSIESKVGQTAQSARATLDKKTDSPCGGLD